jgi:hypothetical protein
MKFIFWIIVIICIWYWWDSSPDPSVDKDLILSDPAAEAHRQSVIRHAKENQIEGYPLYTDEERHIVYQRQYEKEEETPDFIVVVFLILTGSMFFITFCHPNVPTFVIGIICCAILIISGNYDWVVLSLICAAVIIPLLFVMAVKGLFNKN